MKILKDSMFFILYYILFIEVDNKLKKTRSYSLELQTKNTRKNIVVVLMLLVIPLLVIGTPITEENSEKIKIVNRHPAHQMEVSYIPLKKVFMLGDPIKITLHIKNVGNNNFQFIKGGQQRGHRDNQFSFVAEVIGKNRMLPDIGNPTHNGGFETLVNLQPKEEFKVSVNLNRWFKFDEAGIYFLRGSYYMDLVDPDIKSYSSIWVDFATAEFTVDITKDGKPRLCSFTSCSIPFRSN